MAHLRIVADYTDPTYLSGRTIDPSSLPMPAKRMVLGGSTPNTGSRNLGGHMRSPPVSGTAGYHHQPPPPPPPASMSRHRQTLGQPSISKLTLFKRIPARKVIIITLIPFFKMSTVVCHDKLHQDRSLVSLKVVSMARNRVM